MLARLGLAILPCMLLLSSFEEGSEGAEDTVPLFLSEVVDGIVEVVQSTGTTWTKLFSRFKKLAGNPHAICTFNLPGVVNTRLL